LREKERDRGALNQSFRFVPARTNVLPVYIQEKKCQDRDADMTPLDGLLTPLASLDATVLLDPPALLLNSPSAVFERGPV
jgi:hypothetical protein